MITRTTAIKELEGAQRAAARLTDKLARIQSTFIATDRDRLHGLVVLAMNLDSRIAGVIEIER